MSSIKDKLYSLHHTHSHKIESVQSLPDNLSSIQANYFETCYGVCAIREKRFSIEFEHGPFTLDEFIKLPPDIFSLLGKDLKMNSVKAEDIIFIDTETTGLAGGTGTYAFIIGIGIFENDEFKITQLFLPDLDHEAAQLFKLSEIIGNRSCLMSFNGKSYDIPLLKNRLILCGLELDFDSFQHLDLVHTCRRLWKNSIGSCSLQNIEKQILKIERSNDIPGHEIPKLYFNYLQHKEPKPLLSVFKHNVIDLLSLVSITKSCSQIFYQPDKIDSQADYSVPLKTFMQLEQFDKVEYYMVNLPDCIQKQEKLLYWQALFYKRTKQWEKSINCFLNLLQIRFTLTPYIEISKIYEHRLKDYKAALDILNQLEARTLVVNELYDGHTLYHFDEKIRHRKSRLENKIQIVQNINVIK